MRGQWGNSQVIFDLREFNPISFIIKKCTVTKEKENKLFKKKRK